MALDPYAPCPCGSGKKLKFCCSDLKIELEKIMRMFEAEQPVACLEYVKSLLAKDPDRASLLNLRVILERELDQWDDAKQTIDLFLEKHPDHPFALAELTIHQAANEGGRAAAESLVRAIALSAGKPLPAVLLEATLSTAQALLMDGEISSAILYLAWHASVLGKSDPRSAELLIKVRLDSSVPLALKDQLPLADAPDGVAWKEEFEAARGEVRRGAWPAAAKQFEKLTQASGDHPAVWWNLAAARTWLVDTPGVVEALRKYATLDAPLDNRVEAAALAQLLDDSTGEATIEAVRASFAIDDTESLEASLIASDRTVHFPVDPRPWLEDDQPPPRHGFLVLDRPMPTDGAKIPLEDVPLRLANLFVFGKQTDRQARVEVYLTRNELFQTTESAVRELLGDAIAAEEPEEAVPDLSATADLLADRLIFPRETPPDYQRALSAEYRRQRILNLWPDRPHPALQGRSPAEAAPDEASRVAVLAAILVLEQWVQPHGQADVLNELRSQLDLPTLDRIDPDGLNIIRLPLVRLHRLIMDRLSDGDLRLVYLRARDAAAYETLRRVLPVVVAREELEGVDLCEASRLMARMESDPERQIAMIHKARDMAKANGQSAGYIELEELAMWIARGEGEQASRLIARMVTEYRNEPQVLKSLQEMIQEVTGGGGPASGPEPGRDSGEPPADEEQTSQIWTPESDSPRSGTQKSSIWLPE